ncbi:predicted protein [Aspergillus terreus NIH2624]|uniref:Uncharacterized protein n=1 Tax=Aspergillus terreus (strain NIH 2624 / FGSC A1156) TaxID=341663 RepID=Q0CGV0_ASPTN|nr:uncharacterized protein ATEG_07092 [Aspergillus terreus NIH2624]EAU32476.1 predicted protein [Aspergillus terreus NIH2624]
MARSQTFQKIVIASTLLLLLICLWSSLPSDYSPELRSDQANREGISEAIESEESLDAVRLHGFCNQGAPATAGCGPLECNGTIGVQRSFHLYDNITAVAETLQSHPMIEDDAKDIGPSYEEWVSSKWARLAGSIVWLPEQGVYLAITRVVYSPSGILHWPTMSFLRAQVFDEEWKELEGYTLNWNGNDMSFPATLDIPTPWEKGGGFFGPEDPRVILEENAPGAEPVVVFNMRIQAEGWPRAMYIHRPFSRFTTVLTIQNEDRAIAEKNWAPFFLPDSHSTAPVEPGRYLHFVYSMKPLCVLRCSLLSGDCDWVFKQEFPATLPEGRHIDGNMRGGTNFVPLPSSTSALRLYASFPRTHIHGVCVDNAIYRPELVVLTVADGPGFSIAYASGPVDFGSAVLDETARSNPCAEGHILIANSIPRWERQHGSDVMTLSLSVADRTVQIVHLYGVMEFLDGLPFLEAYERNAADVESELGSPWSVSGYQAIICSIEAAANVQV